MARRVDLGIEVDDRTEEMPADALLCRTYGHHWVPVPQQHRRRTELLKVGQVEASCTCTQCGATKTMLFNMYDNWSLAGAPKTTYPEGYLVKEKGTGKLPRSSARAALFERSNHTLV